MATIKDVARHAGVSVGTVSNVTRGAESVTSAVRERVEQAIRELGYRPNHAARSLKLGRSHTLAMVISDITNPFFPLVVRGAEDAALKRGYLLSIFNTDDHVEREREIFGMMCAQRVDGGLVVVAPSSEPPAHIAAAIDSGVPVVCLDRVTTGLAADSVVVDSVKGAAMCTRHLIAMGHRRIGVISGWPQLKTARDRVEGYRLALSEAGIPFDPSIVKQGDFREESGYVLTKDLCLGSARPTALFVANGMMGMGALKATQEIGLRCPQDIAIAVFDEVPGAHVFRPQLTVVSQPAYAMGYKGAELLLQRIAGEIESKDPVTVVLEPQLHIRESTNGSRPRTPES